ncbi:MAG: glycosyltransferase family 4 protein [Magnetococcales bacterium]|nr:glycosyltransferase family 4 protein [Magnetococcales bacterium]
MRDPLRVLTFSTLFPNSIRPHHGIFVEQRLRHLLASGEVDVRVVAPVPWFPSSHPRFGSYADFSRIPAEETLDGLPRLHPRYPLIPKVGMRVAPLLLAATMEPVIRRILREGWDFDLIDAHYLYPDGVAAVMLAKRFGKPVVMTARGSDVTEIPNFTLPRRMIRWAVQKSDGVITVCQALKDALIELDLPPDKITPLRNGVDLERFHPVDRATMRRELGMTDGRIVLLSVGHLIDRKGHDLIIRALPKLPNHVELWIIGDGPRREALEALAIELNMMDRVRFVGLVPQKKLKAFYGSVDALVLASSREGWANVLLEAMACDTPVIASNVWGAPEIVTAPEAGQLMPERSPEGIVAAFDALFRDRPQAGKTRRYAEGFSWEATTRGQLGLFRGIIGK